MGNTPVCSHFSVDVPTLTLVQIYLCLQNIDFLRLHLQLLFEVLLQVLHLLLLRIVVVHKDRLVSRVKFAVQIQLLLALLPNHVKQVGVLLNAGSEFPLSLLQLSLLFLDVPNAFLFSLLVLDLLVKHRLRRTADFK